MKIGELARRANCRAVTVRFYEKKGLMRSPERGEGNYRQYDKADADRLNFIRHCRRHGMSLDDIGLLIKLQESPANFCARAGELVRDHIANIDRQIAELGRLKESLEAFLVNCDGREAPACGVLEGLMNWENCEFCASRDGGADSD